jgi:16S rRNA C967 or C1407 C5-methylase (RsmB/RsmF family)
LLTKQFLRLEEIQREILEAGEQLLVRGKGGVLVYSTCSIDRGENQELVARAAGRFGMAVVRSELTLPAGLPGDEPRRYQDGAYHAHLVREA